MGSYVSKIPDVELEQFASSTFFTKHEISKLYNKFEALGGSLTNPLDMEEMCKLPELRNNPFRYRLCEIFGHVTFKTIEVMVAEKEQKGHEPDGEVFRAGDYKDEEPRRMVKEHREVKHVVMTFNNFLHMLNAFSPRASLQVKTYYAFKLYDFDGDRFINTEDIVKALELMVGEKKMTPEKMHQVAAAVLLEGDLDGTNRLSQTEFIRIIKRIPDFSAKFQFTVEV